MIKLTLQRISSEENCTIGVIYTADSQPLCFSLEEPWKDNKVGISCIPTGKYLCVPHDGTRFKDVWRLENVPNRTAILIHGGNTTDDIEGCILVGQRTGRHKGKRAVLASQNALKTLKAFIGRDTKGVLNRFELEVVNI